MGLWALLLLGCVPDDVDDGPGVDVDPVETATPTPALQFDGDPPRNVLMVSIDTLRRDHLTRYGGAGLTPTLDALAESGVVLDDHKQCAPWTLPGTTCTLAGRDPADLGVLMALDGDTVVPDGSPLLAGWMADAGFQTVLISTNLWLGPEHGNAQGYEVVEMQATEGTTAATALQRGLEVTAALDPARPWLTHVHVMEPHAPYAPPEEYLDGLDALPDIPWDLTQGTGHYRATLGDYDNLPPDEQADLEAHLRLRYAGEVRWVDTMLATALADWQAAGLLDDTLLVVWSDHGEAFWEHGSQGHARQLYAEETRAVALFSAPGLRPAAVSSPTHATDLAPTLLTALGIAVPPELTGLPVGFRVPADPRISHALARDGGISAVQSGGWSLHFRWEDGLRTLHQTDADPGEAIDLYSPSHPELERLWSELEPAVRTMVSLDPELEVLWP